MTEKRNTSPDRQLRAQSLIELRKIRRMNTRLELSIAQGEKRNREREERLNQRVSIDPQTVFINPAVGE